MSIACTAELRCAIGRPRARSFRRTSPANPFVIRRDGGKMRLPILAFHICAGILGLLSGGLAVAFRKGSRRHQVAGNVFVISMLSLSASAVCLAFMKHQT